MEESTHAKDDGRMHLHTYLSWTKGRGVDLTSMRELTFQNVCPRVDVNIDSRPHFWRRAAEHGHFYVVVRKLGTLRTNTNYEPFVAYPVDGAWVKNMWRNRQLTHLMCEELSAECRDGGHGQRMLDLEVTKRTEKKMVVSKRKAQAHEECKGSMKKKV